MKYIKISNLMIRLFLFNSMTFALILTSQLSFGQPPLNFSGVWVLNSIKSGSQFSLMSSSVIITQDLKANTINIDITSSSPEKELTKKTERYILDGKTSVVVGSKEGYTYKSAVWSSNKKEFTVTELKRIVENGTTKESKRTSVYSLDNEGKTMIITIEDTLPEGSKTSEDGNKIIMIFDKAS